MEIDDQVARMDEIRRKFDSGEEYELDCYFVGGCSESNRRATGKSSALEQIAQMVEQGFMPSLEHLVVLSECYREYLDGRGEMTLEDAMHGRAKQKSGSVAKRRAKFDVRMEIEFSLAFHRGKKQGLSDSEAAAQAQAFTENKVGRSPDADTWLRLRRRKRADN